jgi:chromate transport protein ChrA
MCTERWVRLIAGAFIMISAALGWFVSPWFLLFTAFVGANLFQSAISRWCLMEDILRLLGVQPCPSQGPIATHAHRDEAGEQPGG